MDVEKQKSWWSITYVCICIYMYTRIYTIYIYYNMYMYTTVYICIYVMKQTTIIVSGLAQESWPVPMTISFPIASFHTPAQVAGDMFPRRNDLNWLVVLTILKHMSSSMGRVIPYIMENKIHVPNHQPIKFVSPKIMISEGVELG